MLGSRTTHSQKSSTKNKLLNGGLRLQAGRKQEMIIRRCFVLGLGLAALTLGTASYAPGQLTSPIPYTGQYSRGQDVVPVYEGWKPNPDGTFAMYFGYFNRNYQEELDIPIGANNNTEPGPDHGQPTHFYPRRQMFVFKIDVPKDWGLERRLVWTLNIRGKTN